MFTGVSLDRALRYWKNGKEVIVLDRTVKSPSGGYETYSLDALFKNLELLVDVPEVSEMLPARKGNGNQERARELAAQGMSASQIAAELGLKYNTVYHYLHPEKCSKRKKSAKPAKPAKPAPAVKEGTVGRPGWNKDRHACKSCRYRAGGASSGCDYYVITDMERGCDPADCDRYIEGERVERKKK